MSRKRCGCRSKCHCHKQRPRRVVHPVRENVKHRHTEEHIQHVHPSHTRVINHHTIKNEHAYPHSTSYENRVNEVDVRGVSERPCNNVKSEMSHYDKSYHDVRGKMDCNRPKKHCYHHHHCNCHHRRRRSWW